MRQAGDETSDKFEKKWVHYGVGEKWDEERRRYELEVQVSALGAGVCAGRWEGWGWVSRIQVLWRVGRPVVLPRKSRGKLWARGLTAAPCGQQASSPSLTRCALRCHCPRLQRLEAESKSLPDKIREVTMELAELTKKVRRAGFWLAWWLAGWLACLIASCDLSGHLNRGPASLGMLRCGCSMR